MAKPKKSSKKKSMAYRLVDKETGHHYVVRLGREGFQKIKEKGGTKRYNPVEKKHKLYTIEKTTK